MLQPAPALLLAFSGRASGAAFGNYSSLVQQTSARTALLELTGSRGAEGSATRLSINGARIVTCGHVTVDGRQVAESVASAGVGVWVGKQMSREGIGS